MERASWEIDTDALRWGFGAGRLRSRWKIDARVFLERLDYFFPFLKTRSFFSLPLRYGTYTGFVR